MGKCTNFICEKRKSCFHFIGHYDAMKVKQIFNNNETKCNVYTKVKR